MIRFVDCQIIPIEQVKPAPYNPREDLQPGDPTYERIKKSIQKNGIVVAEVWNRRTGNAVSGNQRLKVYQELGYKAIPCNIVDLDLEDEMALSIALNRIDGEFESDSYKALLEELVDQGMDVLDAGVTQMEVEALNGTFDFSSIPDLTEESYDLPVYPMYKCPCCGYTNERRKFKRG